MVTIEDIRKDGRLAYTAVHDEERKGWVVAVCVENQYGYRIIDDVGPWPDQEWAEREAENYNRIEHRTPKERFLIIASTMRRERWGM